MRHLTPIAVACVASLILLGSHTASVATQSSLEDLPPLVGTSARLTAGLDHSAVVTPDGRVCTWGLNWEGQLGVGPTPAQSTEPRCFALAPDVRAVAVSSLSNRTVALTQGGQVYTWGSNLYGQLGVGSDTISSVTTPTPVPFPTGVVVVAVSASERHTIAVTDDGDLYAWGSNQYGQLGNGGTDLTSASRTLLPIPVAQGLGPFTSVAAGGSHTVATTTDGHVFAWGRNHTDQLGPNGPQESGQGPNARYSSSPVEVPGMAGVTSVAAGANHTVAVTSSGAVYTWGQNTRGQLGDRTTTTAPIPIPLILPPMAGVTAGGRTSMAWTEQGALYAWGANDYGQLGDGTLSEAHEPQLVPGVTVAAVAAGPKHTVAVGRDALVYTWGNNESGTLGDQSQTTDHTPRAVDNLPPTTQADAGDEHSLALARDGNVYAWGSNSWGQFTSDHIPFALTPVRISGLPAIAAISAGDFHNAASTAEGQVWTWGRNQYGELGRTTVSQQAPAPDVVNLQASARAVSACHLLTVALTQTDSVYGWGDNSSGQLATSSVSSSASPLLAPEVRAATSVACGDGYSLAIQGTNLYGWGSNSFGQLGARPGDPPATTPTLVTGLNGVIQADTYYRHVLALTSGGAVWALGDNPYGELGRSPAYSDNGWPVPAKITGLADVVEVAAGQNFSMALTDSGTVYTWGNNTNGQLGREAGAMSPTPTPVETLSDVVDIAAGAKHAVAVTTNGDVYTWGDNAFGQLSRPSDCWIPAQRPAAMALWEDPDMPNPTGSPSGNPSDNPSGNPSDNPSGNPTDDPSGNPTDNPSGNPTDDPSENPTDDPSRGPSGDPTGDPRDTQPDNRDSGGDGTSNSPDSNGPSGPGGGQGSSGSGGSGTGTSGLDAAGNAVTGHNPPGAAGPQPGTLPAIAEFGARFKTVVIPAGTTAKLRVVPYRTPGSPAGKATVTWKTSKATVATPVRGKKSGSLAWTTGNTAALTIKALKPGRATLRLSAAGARTGLVTVKVVAKKNAKPIHAVKITSPSCVLLEGRSMVFTPVVSPAGAVRISGTWRSTNPAVATVDAVGRVTGKAKGTSVIVMKTAGKTAKRTVTVM